MRGYIQFCQYMYSAMIKIHPRILIYLSAQVSQKGLSYIFDKKDTFVERRRENDNDADYHHNKTTYYKAAADSIASLKVLILSFFMFLGYFLTCVSKSSIVGEC